MASDGFFQQQLNTALYGTMAQEQTDSALPEPALLHINFAKGGYLAPCTTQDRYQPGLAACTRDLLAHNYSCKHSPGCCNSAGNWPPDTLALHLFSSALLQLL